ncbi:lipid scramblase CLPTM1L-like [Physella acuta]|uniref:lipid scramblase CLPTM1L-like n=1 Tax=Physella acuta TaxID=109671 RepID=UPI0027DAEAA1|nr:lipid scramblase CLPTM1L-like [Physella acuta]XP_059176494.1 lipid scramblase CLPTM1L-like [Physella acuta]
MKALMQLSWTKVLIAGFICYMAYTGFTIYTVFAPSSCNELQYCIKPYLSKMPKLGLQISTSIQNTINPNLLQSVWTYDNFSVHESIVKTFTVSIPKKTRNNGTLYVHAFIYPQGQPPESAFIGHYVSQITRFSLPQDQYINLLGGYDFNITSTASDKLVNSSKEKPHTHLYQHLTVNVLNDNITIHKHKIPGEIYHLLRITRDGKFYYPIVFVDEMAFRTKDLMPVNETSLVFPLTITYSPISLGKMKMWITLQHSFKVLKDLGFTEKDTDEIKGIFVDTSFYLLMLTFIVAGFHLLFDFLAFKNDVMFWRERETMVGVSVRVVIWRCLSTAIIFLYLLDEKTSLLVLIPTGIGMLIEIWKVTKALKVTLHFVGFLPKLQIGGSNDQEKETEAFDSEAMKYLSYVLYPLCFGGAIYSLFFVQHKSWYSWSINSLVNGVYAFGFLFMLPQLFVNYKLKSVAHLPWRAFMYKAFNTFIDDVFAFIITMPTAHRLACFRDDIVFLIYLYQRWLYPVDKKRVNEFGASFKEDDLKVIKKESKKGK